eukprot:TRINITY_DN4232_c0_g1_i7.p1 TRINITY_DN4232_c0_g1~~TRINITY_DN4232_c0_g1_i7.p1  ORF type:complete len:617 (+),score=18.32 TRINITY_DN4232_c0_g1_i7:188-2038(+)
MAPLRVHLAIILVLAIIHAAVADLPALSSYENSALLDPGNFELYWSVNSTAETIHFAARARTSGWLAIGISEQGAMIGSDAMVGWVADGTVFATDRFIFNKSADGSGVAIDAQQDWHLVGGQEGADQSTGDTWTTIHVWRKLDTGDCNDRKIGSPGKDTLVVWAAGDSDSLYQHTNRGMTALVLIPQPGGGPTIVGPAPDGSSPGSGASQLVAQAVPGYNGGGNGGLEVSRFNFSFTNLSISTAATSYWCQVFEIPLTKVAHAVEWGPVINSSEPKVLHHSLLYGCPVDANVHASDSVFECENRVPCNVTFGLWAMGGRPFVYPADVGMKVGPGHFTKFVLQMHYSNPNGLAGVVDNSGIYLKFAPPRKYDAGIMASIVYDRMILIPPGMPSWTRINVCSGECTKYAFEKQPIKIFASAHHMHALGRQLYTDVYRDGKKVSNLTRSDYYDFTAQQILALDKPFELQPGDELRTTCVWDSTSRKTLTTGGPTSTMEMCMDYLLYYPYNEKKPMSFCFDFCLYGKERYMCANNVIPSTTPCNVTYGEEVPREVYQGCPAQSYASVAAIPAGEVTVQASTAAMDTSTTGKSGAKALAPRSLLFHLLPLVAVVTALAALV